MVLGGQAEGLDKGRVLPFCLAILSRGEKVEAGMGHKGIDGLVTGAISKCWRREIDAGTLVSILSGQREADDWSPHLGLFFEELSMESIIRFLLAHELNPTLLVRAYGRHLARGGGRRLALEEWIHG
ncbi:MAG: hypothetical protein ACYCRD_04915 [Leptospirillum sp.]